MEGYLLYSEYTNLNVNHIQKHSLNWHIKLIITEAKGKVSKYLFRLYSASPGPIYTFWRDQLRASRGEQGLPSHLGETGQKRTKALTVLILQLQEAALSSGVNASGGKFSQLSNVHTLFRAGQDPQMKEPSRAYLPLPGEGQTAPLSCEKTQVRSPNISPSSRKF